MKLKLIVVFFMAASFCYAQKIEVPISKTEIESEHRNLAISTRYFIQTNIDFIDNQSELYEKTMAEWEREISDAEKIKWNPAATKTITFFERWDSDEVKSSINSAIYNFDRQYKYYESYSSYQLASPKYQNWILYSIIVHKSSYEDPETDCKIFVRFTYGKEFIKVDAWTLTKDENADKAEETINRLIDEIKLELKIK